MQPLSGEGAVRGRSFSLVFVNVGGVSSPARDSQVTVHRDTRAGTCRDTLVSAAGSTAPSRLLNASS